MTPTMRGWIPIGDRRDLRSAGAHAHGIGVACAEAPPKSLNDETVCSCD
jgi:hypothetical protein